MESVLFATDFIADSSSGLGHQYYLQLGNGWRISAYAPLEGNAFAGNADPNKIRNVDFTLDSKGTKYRCLSLNALRSKIGSIVSELTTLSATPDLLRCPKCSTRYVYLKEPIGDQKWKPFLSCEGMVIVRKGKKKDVACDGTSKRIPALIRFP